MLVERQHFSSDRGELALQRLVVGEGKLSYEQISIENHGPEGFRCLVWSSWQLDNLSKPEAEKELALGKAKLAELLGAWPDAQRVLGDKEISIELRSDYGQGAVSICTLQPSGEIHWDI